MIDGNLRVSFQPWTLQGYRGINAAMAPHKEQTMPTAGEEAT